jgi:predicted outer membrane repeat protein
MKKTIFPFLLILLATLLCTLHTAAATIYLNPPTTIYVNAAATGANDGASWADAYTDLQLALAAAVSGDEIWVAAGAYKPTSGADRNISFVMVGGVAIYGGFPNTGDPGSGDRDWTANLTTLSGDIGTAGSNTDNSYHVIRSIGLTSSALLDGFTISGGNANGADPNNRGGGMFNSSSSPSVTNCTFSNNSAFNGGGMFNSSSSPSLTNCTFSGNSATNGGGMYSNATSGSSSSPTVTNCTFSGNSAMTSGGGMYNGNPSSPTVSNCTFSNNTATNGGGMYNFTSGASSLSNCIFTNNSASSAGGGIYTSSGSPSVSNCTFTGNMALGTATNSGGGGMFSSSGSPTLTGCIFSGNSAVANGGGLQNYVVVGSTSPSLTNCLFLGNSAANGGGCNFTVGSSGTATVVNCSFSGNTASTAGGAVRRTSGTVTLANCILWGNSTEINGTVTATYSIVQGGYSGTGNLDADPEFVDQPPIGLGTAGDLHLSTGSAAYNTGNNASVPGGVTTDLDGNPRIVFTTVDMGAYESQTVLPVELLFFTAKHIPPSGGTEGGGGVRLDWATASEQNNRGFEVQRSTDGHNWSVLGFVAGAGTSMEEQRYEFDDANPLRDVNYYRLRQVDFDGAEEYSEVVSVTGSTDWQSVLRVYPNPASGSLFVEMTGEEGVGRTLDMLSSVGHRVRSVPLGSGSTQQLSLDGLPAGVYSVLVKQDGRVRQAQRVVVR